MARERVHTFVLDVCTQSDFSAEKERKYLGGLGCTLVSIQHISSLRECCIFFHLIEDEFCRMLLFLFLLWLPGMLVEFCLSLVEFIGHCLPVVSQVWLECISYSRYFLWFASLSLPYLPLYYVFLPCCFNLLPEEAAFTWAQSLATHNRSSVKYRKQICSTKPHKLVFLIHQINQS